MKPEPFGPLTIVLFILSILLISCQRRNGGIGNPFSADFILEHQKFLFEREWTTSNTLNGCYIDSAGNVFSYQFDPDDSVFFYSNYHSQTVDQKQLEAKFNHNRTFIKRIPEEELKQHRALIPLTLNADYSDTTYLRMPFNRLIYKCFYFDPSLNAYRIIELEVHGDMNYYNRSQAAVSLTEWLKSVLICEPVLPVVVRPKDDPPRSSAGRGDRGDVFNFGIKMKKRIDEKRINEESLMNWT